MSHTNPTNEYTGKPRPFKKPRKIPPKPWICKIPNGIPEFVHGHAVKNRNRGLGLVAAITRFNCAPKKTLGAFSDGFSEAFA